MTNLLTIDFSVLTEGWRNFRESWEQWWSSYIGEHIDFGLYLIVFSLLAVAFVCIYKMTFRKRSGRLFKWLSRHLLGSALIVWLLGVVIYIVGFYDSGLNGFAIVPRSIISSFKMFVVSHDLARVHPTMQHDAIYMTVFSILHFAAAFISFLFVFKLVGFKIRSSWRIFVYRWFNSKNTRRVHLFWGINEASLLLAESIRKDSKVKDDTLIFVDIDMENDDNQSTSITLGSITNSITINDSEMDQLERLSGVVLVDHCYNGPASLNCSNTDDIFRTLRLNSIGKIVKNSGKVNYYFFSNDERHNLIGALNLKHDFRLKEARVESTIFIHARKSAANEVFDHYSQYETGSSNVEFKLVDSAYLSVSTLKDSEQHLPVDCVKYDTKTGVVESDFTSMVVGFGDTGQEAFKFLYEFATFIDCDKKRVPFTCYAVDAQADSIRGLVQRKMPKVGKDELVYVNAAIDSEPFWQCVEENIKRLNYVIITINNDTLGLSLAVNLFKYALKMRSDDAHLLKIRLRCYNSANERKMSDVVDLLNRSIADEARPAKVDLQLFGREKELYNCRMIINDEILQEAKEFHRVYENSDMSADEQWKLSFVEDKDGNSVVENKMKQKGWLRYHAIYDINRQISQNIANALHSSTKLTLMGLRDATREQLQEYLEIIATRRADCPEAMCAECEYCEACSRYVCDKERAEQLVNMAILEHERWMSAHRLMGYNYAVADDIVKKESKCMCNWHALPEGRYRKYDCNVVDTTIKLAYNKFKK